MSLKSVDVPSFKNANLDSFQYDTCVPLFGHSFNLFDFVSISMKTSHLTYLHKHNCPLQHRCLKRDLNLIPQKKEALYKLRHAFLISWDSYLQPNLG